VSTETKRKHYKKELKIPRSGQQSVKAVLKKSWKVYGGESFVKNGSLWAVHTHTLCAVALYCIVLRDPLLGAFTHTLLVFLLAQRSSAQRMC